MNILIDLLPDSVEIHGQSYRIQPNFRSIILAEQALSAPELKDHEQIASVLDLFYLDIPNDITAALEAFQEFYACYKPPETGKRGKAKKQPNVLSSEHDANLIYTAFLRTYGVNLNAIDYLHWFEYRAMLEDLDEGCHLSRIMEYRGVNLAEIKDPEMKRFYAKMKKEYAIPLDKDTQNHLDELREALKGNGDLSKVLNEGRQ